MAEISLNATKRDKSTGGVLNQLRKEGKVPCVYYSKGNEAIAFSALEVDLNPLIFTSDTNLIHLKIDDMEQLDCIVKDVQFDPITDKIIHIDFMGITYGQLLQLQVPVALVGNAEGVKQGGLLQHFIHKLDVECLPKNIPDHLEIDVTSLRVGDTIHVRDLQYENLTILNSEDAAVVSVTVPRLAVEEEEVEAVELEEEVAEPEVIGKGKSEEEESEEEK
jgi:large subunit ribosomal protein L25